MRKLLQWLIPIASLTAGVARADVVTLDFNNFNTAIPLSAPGYIPFDIGPSYTEKGVTITSQGIDVAVADTRWMHDNPDALLATIPQNGSGLLWSSNDAFEVTAGGRFTLESVDILRGLDNPGMYMRLDTYLGGTLTHSIKLYFPPADPANFAAYIGQQSWIFDFNGAKLGEMDRLVFTGVGTSGRDFFIDDLTLNRTCLTRGRWIC